MKIDFAELKRRAYRSNGGESFEIIDKNEEYQFGVGYERASESELKPYLSSLLASAEAEHLK